MSYSDAVIPESKEPIVAVDAFDLQILALLREDARRSARSIAKRVHKSPGAVLERIGRLEREGVIRGYLTYLDLTRLGMGVAAIVGLQVERNAAVLEMTNQLLELAECEAVYVVTGQWDLLVRLRVRDQRHLSYILFNQVRQLPGFRRSETMVILHTGIAAPRNLSSLLVSSVPTRQGSKTTRRRAGTSARASAAAGSRNKPKKIRSDRS